MVAHVLVGDSVELVRRHPWRDCLARLVEGVCRDPAGSAYSFDRLGVFDVGGGDGLRAGVEQVLGSFDGGGNDSRRGDGAGNEDAQGSAFSKHGTSIAMSRGSAEANVRLPRLEPRSLPWFRRLPELEAV